MIKINEKYWCIEEEDLIELNTYTHDLTQDAALGKLEPMIGRESELDRLVRVLCRRTKNNPVIVGEPGVGKTALVEGLAAAIANHEVPPKLAGSKIITVDLGALIAGTRYRGEFEERLQLLIDYVKETPELILFIDEIHTLIGAGSAEGTMDAANMLKPALSRGQFRCIGATTIDEYRRYIERDPALERRFQPIRVNQPSVEETVDILLRIRQRYEDYHNVLVSNEAVIRIVEMADRYIPGRYFPDKAIDILDEACTLASMAPKITTYERKVLAYYFDMLDEVRREKEDAIRINEFYDAGRAYEREEELYVRIMQLREYLYERAERRYQQPDSDSKPDADSSD
uniref:ATP dependent Clp protease ATP binding subunit clpA-like protein subunit A n=1 Tax=Eustigmatophyceae sp. Ndem 8/9T-3m6.8 TaxID=2506146 RepID=A0A3R5U4W1_9STRA|nr:ATP dependent Clp protease ATP binding subunit clpA-like protein subunit A [Eustigmatophyceae sp. Ndem 8/9T-3m6.8]QAA11835.1 ATP dependent Clp protease ATP binding subunit clpA-like protein subunit A [Eustigmatophyceae sp. Ndem 8/9T-3m6.8]